MYRIFIVEDDETIAKMVAKHLEKWDYEVWTVKMQTAGTFESVKHRIVCKMSGDYIACFYADLLSGFLSYVACLLPHCRKSGE